jgi:hypothetical protein
MKNTIAATSWHHHNRMNTVPMNKPSTRLSALLLAAATLLAGCSKSIVWHEDVQLEGAGLVQVKRTANFKRGSEPGNPLKTAWWPDGGALEFSFQNQNFVYQYPGKMAAFGIFVTAAGKTPLIIDKVAANCTSILGEYRWDGMKWVLQPHVSDDLIGKPRNLMLSAPYPGLDEPPKHVDQAYRARVDASLFANWRSAGITSQATLTRNLVDQDCR